MTDNGAPRHTYALEIAASADRIWHGLTDPDLTKRYYYGAAFRSTLTVGAPYAYSDDGAPDVEGTVIEVDPPRRLRMTARLVSQWLFGQEARAAAPHVVTWTIDPLSAPGGDGRPRCRVTVTCEGFESENVAYRHAVRTTTAALEALRNLLDPDSIPRRVETLGSVEIRELTPTLRDDFLRFFDEDAFRDNPYWGHCYCTGHFTDRPVRTPAESRRMADDLVACGRMQGFLAYVDGKPAAWCNAAPRTAIPDLARDTALAVDDAEQVGSIVCFVTATAYRRHGLARRLLDSAVERFRRQGLNASNDKSLVMLSAAKHPLLWRTLRCAQGDRLAAIRWKHLAYAEAYPTLIPGRGGPGGDSELCAGPLQLYLDAGFAPFRQANRTQIVRKALRN